MTATLRRSPKLPAGTKDASQAVRDAIDTLEDRPRIPEGAPASSSADGFEGQMKVGGGYLHVFTEGQWRRVALQTF